MKIGSLTLNVEMKVVLERLIREIRENGYLYFSKGYKDSGEYLMVQCPYHKNGQEKHPSAQFRKTDGLFYCHGCKESHSLYSVIEHCLDTSGKGWLLDQFEGEFADERQVSFDWTNPKQNTKPMYVDKSVLAQYRFAHPYMLETRHISLDTIRKFDIGYDENYIITTENNGKTSKHEVGECITFPVKDEKGNILFIARRAINQKFFHYPLSVEKPVYGLYEIYREMKKGVEIDEVYICESMINCLTLWTWGKYAVALNGTGSSYQMDILKKSRIRHFILALDPDDAGRRGTDKIVKSLTNKIIEIVKMPTGKDVNDCTKEEFMNLPIKSWI